MLPYLSDLESKAKNLNEKRWAVYDYVTSASFNTDYLDSVKQKLADNYKTAGGQIRVSNFLGCLVRMKDDLEKIQNITKEMKYEKIYIDKKVVDGSKTRPRNG